MSRGDETDRSIGMTQRESADVESIHRCRRKHPACRHLEPIIIS